MKNSNLKVFGLTYIMSATLVIVANFAIYNKIFIPGGLDSTVKNLVDNEQLFRIAIFLDLLYVIFFIIAFTSLYIELKPINNQLALIGLINQLLYIFIFLVLTLDVLEIFRLLNSQIHINNPERFQQIVKNFIGFRFDRYYGGLPLHSIGGVIFSYLLFKSKLIPKSIAIGALIGWIICSICSFSLFAVSGFMKNVNLWIYDILATLSFIIVGGYFIFKPFIKK